MSLEPGGMETCLFAHHHPCAQPRSDPSRPGDLEELRKFCPAELTRLRGCRYSPAAYPFPYRHPRYGGPTSAVPPVNTDGPRIMGRNSTNAELLKRGPLSGMYHASGRIHELSSMELRLCTCKYTDSNDSFPKTSVASGDLFLVNAPTGPVTSKRR